MKDIYLFLDWSMTISEIIKNGEMDKEKFSSFFKALTNVENKFKGKMNFIIISGCSHKSAEKRFNLFKNAFKSFGREDIFKGIAYEYGGYYLNGEENIKIGKELDKEDRRKVLGIANKYGFKDSGECELYLNFEQEDRNQEEKFNEFASECQSKLPHLSFVYFNDKEGLGIDIKDKSLIKGNFIYWLFKARNFAPKVLIAGGDAEEDLTMRLVLPINYNYFIGFKSSKFKQEENMFFSEKDNIDGIIDALNMLVNASN